MVAGWRRSGEVGGGFLHLMSAAMRSNVINRSGIESYNDTSTRMSDAEKDSDATTSMPGASDSSAKEVTFVGWAPGMDELPRKHAPRLHHKKSRAGCQQCRNRRVKVAPSFPSLCSFLPFNRGRHVSPILHKSWLGIHSPLRFRPRLLNLPL